MLQHSSLRETNLDILFPGLGAKDKEVKRMKGFVMISTSLPPKCNSYNSLPRSSIQAKHLPMNSVPFTLPCPLKILYSSKLTIRVLICVVSRLKAPQTAWLRYTAKIRGLLSAQIHFLRTVHMSAIEPSLPSARNSPARYRLY